MKKVWPEQVRRQEHRSDEGRWRDRSASLPRRSQREHNRDRGSKLPCHAMARLSEFSLRYRSYASTSGYDGLEKAGSGFWSLSNPSSNREGGKHP